MQRILGEEERRKGGSAIGDEGVVRLAQLWPGLPTVPPRRPKVSNA
jgi:hypothetical protein